MKGNLKFTESLTEEVSQRCIWHMEQALADFNAFQLGEALDHHQLAHHRLLANALVRVFNETIENRRGAE